MPRGLVLTAPKLPDPLEAVHQQKLFEACALHTQQYPELDDLFAVPNGGYRSKATAASLQRQGVKKGVPDMMLPHGRGGYLGLWIELKRIYTGTPTKEQKQWIEKLGRAGYRAVVCRGWNEAFAELLDYLALPVTVVSHPKLP